MNIEIHGGGFHNQGAELMLRTTLHELGNRLPGFVPIIDEVYDPESQLTRLGVQRLFPPRGTVWDQAFRSRFRTQKIIASYLRRSSSTPGAHTLGASAALVDISGFLHSDQWNRADFTVNFVRLARFYHVRGRPVVLLPQAFGPFSQPHLRRSFSQLLRNCDLAYSRDRLSLEYVARLTRNEALLKRAPDITLFYPEPQPPNLPSGPPYVCLVPNARMLDVGASAWGEDYEANLDHICRYLLAQGCRLLFLEHETTGEDAQIVKRVRAKLASPSVETANTHDAVELKRLVWGSLFVVGSRYHSLVGAFSGSVPAIGLGWSHKYEMLFEDFGCQDLLVGPDTSRDNVESLLSLLLDLTFNLARRTQISARLETMRSANEAMWQQVTEMIARPASSSGTLIAKAVSLLE